ncbi:MAG: CarD family transcriptional regulator, partial [Steroidobacteraceae bacterium]
MSVLLRPTLPGPGPSELHWHSLHAGARALALCEAALEDTRPWACVAADARELERLATELRFFGGAELEILTLPDWEILPYDQFSPHPDIVSERLATLARLADFRRGILLLTADSLLSRLPPLNYVGARSFALERGALLPLEPLRRRLVEAGYASTSQVSGPGEFALRGSLFDVWPMGTETPVRIDLLDERIDSLRRFDPDTQRSLDTLESLRLLPARELPLDAEAVREFRRRFRLRFSGDVTRMSVYRGVSEGLAPPGIEFYLPLFFERTATLADYLPPDLVFAADPGLANTLDTAWQAIIARHDQYGHDIERPLLDPAEIYVTSAELEAQLARHPRVIIDAFAAPESAGGEVTATGATGATGAMGASLLPRDFRLDARATEPLAPLLAFLEEYAGRVLLAADSPGRREVISRMFSAHGRQPRAVSDWAQFVDGSARLGVIAAGEVRSLSLRDPQLMLLSESELFGTRARQERRRRRAAADPATILRNLQTLEPGAPVVHETYGVGRYRGLEVMEIGDTLGEFLLLEYRDGDKVYVPVHALRLVNRYAGGSPETAPLHKLGTEQWARA